MNSLFCELSSNEGLQIVELPKNKLLFDEGFMTSFFLKIDHVQFPDEDINCMYFSFVGGSF